MAFQPTISRSSEVEQFIDQFLSAVCDASRRHILEYLSSFPEEDTSPHECSVGEIAEHQGLAISTTSEHLKQLLQMNLLLARRDGKKTYYRVRNHKLVQAFHDLIGSLETDYDRRLLPPVEEE
jgi:DNA-binding transcriptional ArsR family regulator